MDDNDLNREIAITLLEDEGFTVEYAVNGCEAVEKIMDAPSGHYQLVLMDVQMPVMNGYEATKAIRRLNDPTRASPSPSKSTSSSKLWTNCSASIARCGRADPPADLWAPCGERR